MSSDISSLATSFGDRPHPLSAQPRSGAMDDIHAAMGGLSIDEQAASSSLQTKSPDHETTVSSHTPDPDTANILFYQSPPHNASVLDANHNPTTSPRKCPRQQGPIDHSNNTHPNGLADIQVQAPLWRNRDHKPLGIRLPSQLLEYGKFNLRYEAWRDLPPDEAFDPYLRDSQQSLPPNHYATHNPAEFPSPFADRAPSPPLPATVMQNLQLRTLTMVNAYAAAEQKREELLRHEAELDTRARELRERLVGLDQQLAALGAASVTTDSSVPSGTTTMTGSAAGGVAAGSSGSSEDSSRLLSDMSGVEYGALGSGREI